MPNKPQTIGSLTRKPRENSNARGYTRRWGKVRLDYLRRHPLCAECGRNGRLTAATCVDHVRPHKGNDRLFWDEENWQSLCGECHGRKTAKEGGFGI